MFKYMIVFALALVVVMAAPPAPKDLNTANQLLYSSYGGYPSAYSAGYSAYPYAATYGAGYAAYPAYNYGYNYYG